MTHKWGIVLMLVLELSAAPRILVHGHRGARAVRPENTLPAFEYAVKAGVDALELDLAVTSDNVLVVSHDPVLNPKICTGPKPHVAIHSLTLSELRAYDCGAQKNPDFPKQEPVPGTPMPTLDEVFALAPQGTFDFNVETKISKDKPELAPPPDVFAELVVNSIRKHHLENRVIVQSFDFRTLHEIKKLAPEIRLSALYAGIPRSFVEIAREAQAGIVSPHYRLVSKMQVDAAHRAGIQVVPWTPNTPGEWKEMARADVDAIITDDPAGLISYLKQQHP